MVLIVDLVVFGQGAIRLVNLRKLHIWTGRHLLLLGRRRLRVLDRGLQVLRLQLLDVGEVRLQALGGRV